MISDDVVHEQVDEFKAANTLLERGRLVKPQLYFPGLDYKEQVHASVCLGSSVDGVS